MKRRTRFPQGLGGLWHSLDLAHFFETSEDIPVFVENDATVAAHGELALGTGSRFRDFMHISIDTFVGGGLVMDGKVHTGPHGNSAALGPLPVSPSKLTSIAARAARYASLLHRASVYVLMNHLRTRGVEITRVRALEPLAEAARLPVQE